MGERRPGWDRPGRSAVLGRVAAALGLDRAAEAEHLALEAGLGMAVRTDAAGRVLVDYHTAQVPRADRRRGRLPTRAAELAQPELETILTRREYRTDALHLVALWARGPLPAPLAELHAALLAPRYVLYAGRKSCPLGLPLDPRLIEAADAPAALAARAELAEEPEALLYRRLRASPGTVALDPDGLAAADVARLERRRDRLVSRRRWQFAEREEAILRPMAGKP